MKPRLVLAAACTLALAATLPPLLPAFPAHMLRHMLLVAVSAPLLVLAFPDPLIRLAPPVAIGCLIEFATVWGWHLPALHAAARSGTPALALAEQASFLAAGIAVWAAALRPGQAVAGAAGLSVTSMHMTLLGALFILSPRDLYAGWCGMPPDITAQSLGGLTMLAIGMPAYLAGGVWLLSRALQDSAPRPAP
ncbi:cytochrome c oxidase assembly protein [Paragemmobacter aquarius]|uniref:cytochrome c oxidase assembly protein n=1 Tax=Paragemmobacter aquarius TaxID=2169400 RepID=UPI001E5D3CC5|nr:cytochrome c oxidase assembly protein [Gemmobacter aquarius]